MCVCLYIWSCAHLSTQTQECTRLHAHTCTQCLCTQTCTHTRKSWYARFGAGDRIYSLTAGCSHLVDVNRHVRSEKRTRLIPSHPRVQTEQVATGWCWETAAYNVATGRHWIVRLTRKQVTLWASRPAFLMGNLAGCPPHQADARHRAQWPPRISNDDFAGSNPWLGGVTSPDMRHYYNYKDLLKWCLNTITGKHWQHLLVHVLFF